jgi:enoyl-CoA hydratase/carnithine racemase
MTRLLGTAKAMELMLLGDAVDAATAERIGLVHRAVAPDRLMPDVLALAAELASRPRLSIAMIKQCVLQGAEMPLIDAALRAGSLLEDHALRRCVTLDACIPQQRPPAA